MGSYQELRPLPRGRGDDRRAAEELTAEDGGLGSRSRVP